MIFVVEDTVTFGSMKIQVDEAYCDQFKNESDLFDPYISLYIYKKTGEWPTLGVAGEGWSFCSCANEGDRISSIELAIDSGRLHLLLPILDILDISNNESLRREASKLAKKLLNGIGTFENKERIQIQALKMLLGMGAVEEGDFGVYEDKAVWFTPNCQYSNGVRKSFFGVNDEGANGFSLETNSQDSFLVALLLSDIKDDAFRDEALMNILGSDRIRALEYRAAAYEGGTLAHLCIRAGQEETLQKMIQYLGEPLMNQVDGLGRTLEDFARELNKTRCEHVLRSSRAKNLTLSILAEIMGDTKED